MIVGAGADPRVTWEAMSSSWAASVMLGQRPPLPGLVPGSPADEGYQGAFSIDYMVKDLDAIMATARQVGARHPVTGLVRALFAEASGHGDGALDVTGLFRTLSGGE
jgi:3-hydroxyisobutyrate dehydrogenase